MATDHDFNRCRCDQWGRCLVHCPTCDCPGKDEIPLPQWPDYDEEMWG